MAETKPSWLKVRAAGGENYLRLKAMMSELKLATVCQEAKCPNIGECWSGGTATVMLMGEVCTRGCRFCAVKTGNPRGKLDTEEPQKVGYAISQMGLEYVVLTSVDRDDLPDQGAGHFAQTIEVIKAGDPDLLVEVLTPDFRGERRHVETLVAAKPDVFAHNVETVERLTKRVRDPRATYRQSLDVLRWVKEIDPSRKTKSSIMLGLGEEKEEVIQTLRDLRAVDCDVVTFGQYLQPTPRHLKVVSYVTPDEFIEWQKIAESMGFLYVASGPMVRSSYRAGEFFMKALIEKDRRSRSDDTLAVEDWGLIDYAEGFAKQTALAEKVLKNEASPTLVFCSHPPVVTLGRKTNPGDVDGWQGEVVSVNRGGSATYHGPNQLVVYPILNLNLYGRDLHRYLRCLERAVVRALKTFGITAEGSSKENGNATGVWVGPRKIASIGIGVRNWVTLHGLALNLENDPSAFQGIRPCGFSTSTMTSLEEVAGTRVDRVRVREVLEAALRTELEALARASIKPSEPERRGSYGISGNEIFTRVPELETSNSTDQS